MTEQLTGTTEVKQKVPWVLIAIAAIGAAFVAQVVYTLAVGLGNMKQFYSWGATGAGLSGVATLSYGFLILTYPIVKILRRRISPATLTYIFTIGTVVSYVIQGASEQFPVYMAEFRVYDVENVLTGWWQVPQNLCQKLIVGNVVVDWVAWSPSIFFWTAQFIAFYFLSSAVIIIFRHQWMDVERIPFPLVIAGNDILQVISSKENTKRDLRPFIIGLLIGLAFEVPVFLQGIFPWFPDIYGYRTNTCCSGTWCLPIENVLSSNIVGLTMIIKNPLYYAIFYLAPLSVSFNAWFWTFVVWIFLQVAYYMGYYTGMLSTSGSCRQLWGGANSTFISPPFGWDYVSGIGGMLGITIFAIYLRRSYLVETLKSAMGRTSKLSEIEKNEPMKYRNAYIMFIAGSIIMVALLLSAGIEFAAALVIIFPTALVTYFSGVLVWGNTGVNIAWSWSAHSPWALHVLWPQVPENYSTNWVMSHWLAFIPGTNMQGYDKGFFSTAQSLKMGSLTNTNAKDIYLIATVTMILGLITAMLTSVWLYNYFGSSRLGTPRCSILKYCAGALSNMAAMPSIPVMLTYAAVGFILTGLLSVLHARFMWFPFEPIGFVIGTSQSLQQLGVWSAFLFAWAVKSIVLRTGGSKLYERSIGIVGGYVTGTIIVIIFASIIGGIRFFYPF